MHSMLFLLGVSHWSVYSYMYPRSEVLDDDLYLCVGRSCVTEDISQLERQLITKTGDQDEAHQAHLSCAGPPGCWWCCAPLCFVWPNYIR